MPLNALLTPWFVVAPTTLALATLHKSDSHCDYVFLNPVWGALLYVQEQKIVFFSQRWARESRLWLSVRAWKKSLETLHFNRPGHQIWFQKFAHFFVYSVSDVCRSRRLLFAVASIDHSGSDLLFIGLFSVFFFFCRLTTSRVGFVSHYFHFWFLIVSVRLRSNAKPKPPRRWLWEWNWQITWKCSSIHLCIWQRAVPSQRCIVVSHQVKDNSAHC